MGLSVASVLIAVLAALAGHLTATSRAATGLQSELDALLRS